MTKAWPALLLLVGTLCCIFAGKELLHGVASGEFVHQYTKGGVTLMGLPAALFQGAWFVAGLALMILGLRGMRRP